MSVDLALHIFRTMPTANIGILSTPIASPPTEIPFESNSAVLVTAELVLYTMVQHCSFSKKIENKVEDPNRVPTDVGRQFLMEITLDRTAPCGMRPRRSLSAPSKHGCPGGTSSCRAGCTKPRSTAGRTSLRLLLTEAK